MLDYAGGGGVVLPGNSAATLLSATTRTEARGPFRSGGVELKVGGRSSKKRVRVRVSSMILFRGEADHRPLFRRCRHHAH